MKLDSYSVGNYSVGAPLFTQILWYAVSSLFFASSIPGSAWRRLILKVFRCQVGVGVVLKPRVRIKYPWKLRIGDHSWIGEEVWIDNVTCVVIGSHTCISQGAYLCGGSHDYTSENFDLRLAPIEVGNHVWVAARAIVAPGATLADGVVLTLGSLATGGLDAWGVYSGVPAQRIKERRQVADASTAS